MTPVCGNIELEEKCNQVAKGRDKGDFRWPCPKPRPIKSDTMRLWTLLSYSSLSLTLGFNGLLYRAITAPIKYKLLFALVEYPNDAFFSVGRVR